MTERAGRSWWFAAWALFGVLLLGASQACSHYRTPSDKLRESVMDYNNAMRWRNWEAAARYVPEDRRDDFMARKDGQGDRMRVTDFEVRDVRHDSRAKRAFVIVEFAWHRYPSLTMERTRLRQEWDFLGGRSGWVLRDQTEIEIEEESDDPTQMF